MKQIFAAHPGYSYVPDMQFPKYQPKGTCTDADYHEEV